jgi:hypothetical protein
MLSVILWPLTARNLVLAERSGESLLTEPDCGRSAGAAGQGFHHLYEPQTGSGCGSRV